MKSLVISSLLILSIVTIAGQVSAYQPVETPSERQQMAQIRQEYYTHMRRLLDFNVELEYLRLKIKDGGSGNKPIEIGVAQISARARMVAQAAGGSIVSSVKNDGLVLQIEANKTETVLNALELKKETNAAEMDQLREAFRIYADVH